ncbi:MAG: CAP domain-containing protein [Bacteroidales bacterium]
MRTSRVFSAAIFSALCGCVVAASVPGTESARAMLDAVNAQRRAHGVRPLTLDARLNRAAAAHAHDLARTGRLSHTGSDGSKAGDRVDRAGYRWSEVAENLAESTATSPSAIVADWMRSRPHRKNMLNGAYRDLGVGHEGRIWVIVLGKE